VIGRSGLGLSLLAIISLATGFATQMIMIGLLGANRVSDAYFIALAVPQFFLTVLVEPVISVLIPLIAASEHEDVQRRSTVVLVLAIGVSVVSAVVAAVATPLWIPHLVPGFTPGEQALETKLVLVQLLSLAPAAGSMIWKASCYARRRFVASEAVWVAGAVLSLFALFVTVPRYGVVGAVWVNVVRFTVTLLALIALERVGRPDPIRGEFAATVFRRARPLMIGAAYAKSEPLVDQHLTSMSTSGDVTLFSFCRTLTSAGVLVLSQAFITPQIPDLAVLAKDGNWEQLRSRMRHRTLLVSGVTAAAVALFAIAGLPALELLANVWPRAADIPLHTFWALIVLLAGIPLAGGGGMMITATYYAMGETRLLMIVNMIDYTISIAFKFGGFAIGGLWGLAVATSAYYALDMAVQWIMIERRLGRLIQRAASRE
jgi:putative peptidoglycan lipid II flippase